jgi:hypothetical protein
LGYRKKDISDPDNFILRLSDGISNKQKEIFIKGSAILFVAYFTFCRFVVAVLALPTSIEKTFRFRLGNLFD